MGDYILVVYTFLIFQNAVNIINTHCPKPIYSHLECPALYVCNLTRIHLPFTHTNIHSVHIHVKHIRYTHKRNLSTYTNTYRILNAYNLYAQKQSAIRIHTYHFTHINIPIKYTNQLSTHIHSHFHLRTET